MQEQAYFHTKGYCAHRTRCVKCGKSQSTKQCTLPKTQPATCLHCGESHAAIYRGCKVYLEIISTRFSSPRTTASIHITNTPGQENESPAAPQLPERRPKMTYAQATRKANNRSKQHTRTYTNQNNARVLHKVRNNLVQTS
jgi:hypothetical protein